MPESEVSIDCINKRTLMKCGQQLTSFPGKLSTFNTYGKIAGFGYTIAVSVRARAIDSSPETILMCVWVTPM